VLALAQHPSVGPSVNAVTGGRRALAAALLRGAGPPLVLVEDRWIVGWGCAAAGCAEAALFLAHDAQEQRIYLVITEGRVPTLHVPPRRAPWPAELRATLARFDPSLAATLRFDAPG
jgi:malic enzyme